MAIEHHRRRRVLEASKKNRLHAGFAHIRKRACAPSAIISAADRATAANSQSTPPSRAMNSSFQPVPFGVNSSWPSVIRRISLTGPTHSAATCSFLTIAPNDLRSPSRSRFARERILAADCGSLSGSPSRLAPRSRETTCEASRKVTSSSHDGSRAARPGQEGVLAKSTAKRPPNSTRTPIGSVKGKPFPEQHNRLTLSHWLLRRALILLHRILHPHPWPSSYHLLETRPGYP